MAKGSDDQVEQPETESAIAPSQPEAFPPLGSDAVCSIRSTLRRGPPSAKRIGGSSRSQPDEHQTAAEENDAGNERPVVRSRRGLGPEPSKRALPRWSSAIALRRLPTAATAARQRQPRCRRSRALCNAGDVERALDQLRVVHLGASFGPIHSIHRQAIDAQGAQFFPVVSIYGKVFRFGSIP